MGSWGGMGAWLAGMFCWLGAPGISGMEGSRFYRHSAAGGGAAAISNLYPVHGGRMLLFSWEGFFGGD
jgi:hypothetical protein